VLRGNLVITKVDKMMTNLYVLMGDTLQEVNAIVTSSQENATMTWHRKLGQMSEQGLQIPVECNLLRKLKEVDLPFYEHSNKLIQ